MEAYNLLQKQAETNKQIYTVLRFACQCKHVSALVLNTYESATAFIAAKVQTIRMYSLADVDDTAAAIYQEAAKNMSLDFNVNKLAEDGIEDTELLYINTPSEGTFRANELVKFNSKVSKYILLPNTTKFGLHPSDNIKLGEGQTPIGLVFGINHFIQTHDNWFILEHDDIDPGMTVLVNKQTLA